MPALEFLARCFYDGNGTLRSSLEGLIYSLTNQRRYHSHFSLHFQSPSSILWSSDVHREQGRLPKLNVPSVTFDSKLLKMFRCLFLVIAVQMVSARHLRALTRKLGSTTDPLCVDTTARFDLDGNAGPKDCAWLSQHQSGEYANPCDLHRVSSLCRGTCDVCQETSVAIDLLKTCSDRPNPISIPGMESDVSCEWLRRNKQEHGDACKLTKVALHCPSACGTFGLCVQEQDQNA